MATCCLENIPLCHRLTAGGLSSSTVAPSHIRVVFPFQGTCCLPEQESKPSSTTLCNLARAFRLPHTDTHTHVPSLNYSCGVSSTSLPIPITTQNRLLPLARCAITPLKVSLRVYRAADPHGFPAWGPCGSPHTKDVGARHDLVWPQLFGLLPIPEPSLAFTQRVIFSLFSLYRSEFQSSGQQMKLLSQILSHRKAALY